VEIACAEASTMSRADLAFQVRAVNIQLQQLAQAYDEKTWTVRSYATLPEEGDYAAMIIMDEIDEPSALGFHDLTILGKPYGRCKVTKDVNDASVLSHECLELARDPFVNLWLPLPDGRRIAYECADPCQEDAYVINVTIGSETRGLWVSDFVLPAYFVEGAMPPYTFCGTIDEPFGVSRNGGGWRLVRDQAGKVTSEYGPIGASPELHAAMAKRAQDTGSRTHRRGYRGGA
jgi:hypothetical protein